MTEYRIMAGDKKGYYGFYTDYSEAKDFLRISKQHDPDAIIEKYEYESFLEKSNRLEVENKALYADLEAQKMTIKALESSLYNSEMNLSSVAEESNRYMSLYDQTNDKLAKYQNTGLKPEEIPTGYELANVYAALQELKRYKSIGTVEQFDKLMNADHANENVSNTLVSPVVPMALMEESLKLLDVAHGWIKKQGCIACENFAKCFIEYNFVSCTSGAYWRWEYDNRYEALIKAVEEGKKHHD